LNLPFITFALALVAAQFAVPRRYSLAPILVAACHLPYHQGIDIGGLRFTAIRLVIVAGVIRAVQQRALTEFPRHSLDQLMVAFAFIGVVASIFHKATQDFNPMIVSLSQAFDYTGVYLLARAYLKSPADLVLFGKSLVVNWPRAGRRRAPHPLGRRSWSSRSPTAGCPRRPIRYS
jgi:hypothetical protein